MTTPPNPFAAPEPGGQPAGGTPSASPPGYGPPAYGPPAQYGPVPDSGQPPPGYGPPSYGSPQQPYGYGSPFGVPVQQSTNGFAIASLVCGIAGFFLLLPSVLAVVFGHLAKSQIRQRQEGGAGLATAGLITGYLGIAFLVLIFSFITVGVVGVVGAAGV